MEAIRRFSGRLAPLPQNDVDTDQIIPARFLKVTDRAGLGEGLFYDWRYDDSGRPRPDFVLNQECYRGASLLLAGDNFGCGSSREHAPWALLSCGFRAVISTSFADIFRNNSLKNGLLPIVVDAALHGELLRLASDNPQAELTVDLQAQHLELPDGRMVPFPIDGFSRECLLQGVDELGYLLKQMPVIESFEEKLDFGIDTLAEANEYHE